MGWSSIFHSSNYSICGSIAACQMKLSHLSSPCIVFCRFSRPNHESNWKRRRTGEVKLCTQKSFFSASADGAGLFVQKLPSSLMMVCLLLANSILKPCFAVGLWALVCFIYGLGLCQNPTSFLNNGLLGHHIPDAHQLAITGNNSCKTKWTLEKQWGCNPHKS